VVLIMHLLTRCPIGDLYDAWQGLSIVYRGDYDTLIIVYHTHGLRSDTILNSLKTVVTPDRVKLLR
jgi:rhodanese-related sulfurtransferase